MKATTITRTEAERHVNKVDDQLKSRVFYKSAGPLGMQPHLLKEDGSIIRVVEGEVEKLEPETEPESTLPETRRVYGEMIAFGINPQVAWNKTYGAWVQKGKAYEQYRETS